MQIRTQKKQLLSCLLAATMLLPMAAPLVPQVSVLAADDKTDSASAAVSDASEWVTRTADEVFEKMRCVAENDALALYAWDEAKVDTDADEKPEDIFALVNRKNGYVWWSSPINAAGDSIATPVLQKELASALMLTVAQPDARSSANVRSGDSGKTTITYADIQNGVRVTYYFRKSGIKIPVSYVLGEDYLQVTIDSKDLTEKYGADSAEDTMLAQSLSVFNAFGAADKTEEGYFVVPDGCGALIRFNNQKYSAKTFNQPIYGSDTTAVPKTKPAVTAGVSLPMFGIVKGENALLAVATSGDGNCAIRAAVSGTGQSNTDYNLCYFQYVLRSVDSYYLGSDQLNPLDVYEKNLQPVTLQARYYPLCNTDEVNADGGKTLDYVDIAARYRQYLQEDEKLTAKTAANQSALYLDVYGGTKKQKNILGFPVYMKTGMTSFAETKEIVQAVRAAGVDDIVLSLNNWTNAGVSGSVDYKAKPAGVLGGRSDFSDLVSYLDETGTEWYPTVNNTSFYSGGGYWSLTDTAVRVSGSFARIVDYERAYGVPYGTKKTMSLLSPKTFASLYETLAKNYKKAGLSRVSLGVLASTLYGDYGKHSATSREQTMQTVTNAFEMLQREVGSVLSKDPNAYVLPYTTTVSDLPLSSSGFDVLDEDVPLYQLVLHGVLPYATKAINGSADAEHLVMQAIATGSNLHFDMVQEDINELKDTDFDIYFYAGADHWKETAAKYYLFAKDVLAKVSDSYIIGYATDGNLCTTTYANGVQTVVDLEQCSVTCDGETRYLRDYVEEGAVVFA